MNFCNNCGSDLKEHKGARFCHNCGNHLSDYVDERFGQERKDNTDEVIRSMKSGLLNLLSVHNTNLKNTLRAVFKSKYSDFWFKEETELANVVEILSAGLKRDSNTEIISGIKAFKSFLRIDSKGSSEKVSESNLKVFLNTSNGRSYGHCYTEFIRLINSLENKLGATSVHQIENDNFENDASDADNDQISSESSRNKTFGNGYNSYGIIFTNLNALANRLNCGEEEVEAVILNYISQVEECGHQYVLLDAGNNTYSNIDPDDGWQSHVAVLKDFYHANSQAEYLFIIGGHDVVPIAIIDNVPRCYKDDPEIDTDMPYGYLIDSGFEDLLWNGNLFKKDIFLYCGRLPIPSDRSLYDVDAYLSNSINVISGGIDTENCFGMTAKSWERASSTIIKKLQLTKELHTSPEHNIQSAKEVFNTQADIYYFNLHGSDSPGSPEFFGDKSPVITPEYLNQTENLNFLMTEACYGAKFIHYESYECMLLTSLFNRTVVYTGSSKVAFGSSTENISSADVVAKSFLENILSGEPCGRALAYARIDVFDACSGDHYDYGTTSAAEFNLFGEPLCSIYSNRKRKSFSLGSKKMRSKSFNNTRPEKKEIKLDAIEKGILNDVRNLINQEVLKIRELINRELYEQFNIEPRQLSTVFEIKGKYGEVTYNYNYYKEIVSGKSQVYSVFADRSGKIKSIIQSK